MGHRVAELHPLGEQLLFMKGPLKGGSTAGMQDVLSYPLLS